MTYPDAKSQMRQYRQRVREVERGVFTPLVFTTSGGMAKECLVFHKRLASLIATKSNQPYAPVMKMIRCSIQFALIRLAVMCLRGSRSSYHRIPIFNPAQIPLVVAEGQIGQ
jgi:hypothetical protein